MIWHTFSGRKPHFLNLPTYNFNLYTAFRIGIINSSYKLQELPFPFESPQKYPSLEVYIPPLGMPFFKR